MEPAVLSLLTSTSKSVGRVEYSGFLCLFCSCVQLRQYAGVSEQLEELRSQSEQLRQNHDLSKAKHKRHMQRAKERQAQVSICIALD